MTSAAQQVQQLQASSSTALVLPGATVSQAPTPATGVAKIEPRLLSILTTAGVPSQTMEDMGTKGFDSVAIYGNVAATRERMEDFLKAVLNVDPGSRPEDYLLLLKLLTAWDACRTRVEVELRHNAERAVNQLAPQISTADCELAIQAFERMEGYEPGKYPRHWIPSQPFFERLVGQAETFFEMSPLTRVTSKGQEDSNQSEFGGVDIPTGLFKVKKQEFAVAYPSCPESLRNRLKVLSVCWMMVQSRYPSNPKIATATLQLFDRYVEYLIGSRVWGMVSVGLDNRPISSPCCEHVLGYDQAMRRFAADAMNAGWDVKTAFEKALGDADTRQLNFTTPVAVDAGTKKCTDLSAPGLMERFPSMPIQQHPRGSGIQRATKRQGAEVQPPPIPSAKAKSQTQRRTAAKKKLQEENARLANQLKQAQNRKGGAGPKGGGAGPKGGGAGPKGGGGAGPKGGGAGKGGLPAGVKKVTAGGQFICFNWNQGTACRSTPCNMAHVCWFCEGADPAGGMSKTC